ncbi:MAG: hypothetical protein WCX22_06725 [Methanoregula sp.]
MVTQEECIALRSRDLFVGTIVPERFCPGIDEFSEPVGYMNEIFCSGLIENFFCAKKMVHGRDF